MVWIIVEVLKCPREDACDDVLVAEVNAVRKVDKLNKWRLLIFLFDVALARNREQPR